MHSANDMVHHCMYTWIILGLLLACLCCCINYVCRAKLHDDWEPYWLRTARNRRMKRKWVRLGKGRLTPETKIMIKQLDSMQ